MSNIRTYKLTTLQNEKKTNLILDLYSEYKKYYKQCINRQYVNLIKNGRISGFIDTKKDKSKLSERFKRQAMQQATGQLESWFSNRNNRIIEIISSNNSLSDIQKRKLHLIRIFNVKAPQDLNVKSKKQEEVVTILKTDIQIFKAIYRSIKWNLPSHKRISMQLNNNTCKLIPKKITKKTKAQAFDYWIELSTLNKGKKIFIPANGSKYLSTKLETGKLLNAIRIDFKDDKIVFNILIDKTDVEPSDFKTNSIGIDFGTKHLFALSTGQIFGVNFGKQLYKFDKKISVLQKRLQKQGVKPNESKRYRELVRKCKEFIKNEINRNLNKIMKEINPKEIVLENLDFRGSKLSKSMNRILRKCGRSVVKSKLAMLKKDFKIKSVEVNPAYTSQTCPRCKFVHKSNRNKRDNFKCKLCNYKKHADINASKNIEARSSCPVLRGKSGKRTIKNHLFDLFKQQFLQCGDLSSNTKFISPDRRAIFLQYNPSSFEEFVVLLKRNKQILTKLQ